MVQKKAHAAMEIPPALLSQDLPTSRPADKQLAKDRDLRAAD